MAGYTDAVVLEAPVFWWPSVGELTKHPLDFRQSFLASVADAAMPWPCGVDNEADHVCLMRTVGLSRLGRSVWMTAEWSSMEDGDEQPFVKVWSPVQAEALFLPVCTSVGLGSSVTTFEELLKLSVPQLAREGRIRLTHRAIPTGLCSRSTSANRLLERLHRRVQQHLAYPLLRNALTQVHASSLQHLKRVIPTAAASSPSSPVPPLASSPPASGSVLLTGDTPTWKHFIALLQRSTPSLFPVGGKHVAAVALEVRRLNFAEVLTLKEHEALETIEVALRPPPLSPASSNAAVRSFLPCLLIVLESLHMLEAHANSLVAGVTHQLCMCLEAVRGGPVPALVWSFAEDTSAIPVALLSRVGAQHIRLSTTTPEARTAYLMRRMQAMRQHTAVDAAAQTAAMAGVAALTEETARWTVDRLVRLRDAELLEMCAAQAGVSTSSPPCSPEAPSPSATEHKDCPGKTIEEPVHAVYRHLYGINDSIRNVEELVVWPLTHLSLLRELSIPCSKGVLICGPSGSGKTALLSGLVRRLQLPDTRSVHVLSVDGLSLIDKEVGRTEKRIAQLFEAARSLAPTALFIDNLDALAPPRGRTTAEMNTTGDRTLSTLLTQMDGVSDQADRVVVVVASAPSVSTLDPAVCRPGRLDVHVQLRLPPACASAAFMKQRLRDFIAHMQSRLYSSDEDDAEGEVANEFVSGLVDAHVAAMTASALRNGGGEGEGGHVDPAGTAIAAMSPAEASAVVREVMLYVAEQLRQSRSSDEERKSRDVLRSEIQQHVTAAFAKLDTRGGGQVE
ncbi:cell division cycle protein-like protein [Leptomonas seymouri]|uniref:Cell division cycle protein-like protein n=1 Tax=Leptomonas seymouri TaxID=5684 RepID=A0A0N0P4E7_LEPSE|nr:cell division cycle protein-like protein [Leptomonas seymouri]|eukprot:KPI84747.1 cell division cycle protein-like protein [Leptomonas seymouri]